MTRDELEAVIWRRWPTRGPRAGEAVDAILAAADLYGLAEYGITAERRAVLARTSGTSHAPTHYTRDGRLSVSACGGCTRQSPRPWMATADPAKVTCRTCKRTGAWQAALREAS